MRWPNVLAHSPQVLPWLSINESAVLYGMLSIPKRLCGPQSLVSDAPMIHLVTSSSWKSAQMKEMENPLWAEWLPTPSWPCLGHLLPLSLPHYPSVPANRLLGQLASLLGCRNRSPAESGTWITNSDVSNEIPIGSWPVPWREWQSNITLWVVLALTHYPFIYTWVWCGGDREEARNYLRQSWNDSILNNVSWQICSNRLTFIRLIY